MAEITIWKWLAAIIIILTIFLYVPTYIAGPDGLEAVFQTYSIEPPDAPWIGFFPDYTFPGISDPLITSFFAGVIGTLVVFGIAYGIGKLIVVKKEPD